MLGLHEVRRGLVTKKIQLLLLATDIEGCDVLDDRLAEILAIARREDVPVAFPMNRCSRYEAADADQEHMTDRFVPLYHSLSPTTDAGWVAHLARACA